MKSRFLSVVCLILATALTCGVLFTSCEKKKDKLDATEYLTKIIEASFGSENEYEPTNTSTKLIFAPSSDIPVQGLNAATLTTMVGTSGESVVTFDAVFGSDKVDLALYGGASSFIASSSLFGGTNYGFGAEDLEDIITLVSGMLGGADGSPDVEPYADDEATAIIETLKSLLEGKNGEKLASFAEKYMKILAESVDSASKNNVTVGSEVKVSVEFNTDSAKKAIKDVFTAVQKDKELRDFAAELLSALGMDKTEAKAQIDAILSDETLNSVFEALETMPFSVNMVVTADKNYIFKSFDLDISANGEEMGFFFDMSDVNNIEIGISSAYSDEDSNKHTMEEKLVIKTKTANGATTVDLSAVSSYDGDSETTNLLSFTTNENGNYSVTVYVSDLGEEFASVTAEGTITTEEDVTTVTVTKLSSGEESITVNLTMIIETGVTLPKFPTEYKNVLEMTDDDIAAIMEALMESPLGQFIPEEPEEDPDYSDDEIWNDDELWGDDYLGEEV